VRISRRIVDCQLLIAD